MIKLILKGGFGNHLMTYFLGCILADKFNDFDFIFNIQNINKSTDLDTQTTIYKVIKNINLINDNNNNNNNNIYLSSCEDYLNIFNCNYNKKNTYIIELIHINEMDFYLKNIDIIKKYLTFNRFKNNNNSIVLSLRLGLGINEICIPSPYENELRLPFEYYKKSICYLQEKNSLIDKLIICSDDFDNEYLKNFEKIEGMDIIFYKKNSLEQFELLINAQNFISSNSSFSILAVLFNDNNVIFPIFSDSNSPIPGIENTRYSKILNIEKENCYKMLINK